MTLTLPAERDSAAKARQYVRTALAGLDLLDDVLLCVSELVTNAVLHAGSPCELTLERSGSLLRVGVRDLVRDRLPQKRNFDRSAVTGRGLSVIEALVHRWGVESDDAGKTVWFEVVLDGAGVDLVRVSLLGLPVTLHQEVAEQAEALRREFALISAAGGEDVAMPARLLAVNEEIRSRFGGFAAATAEQLQRAISERRPTIDLDFDVPLEAGPGASRLRELYDEADEYCRAGEHLLTLATPPEGVLYRAWFCGEFTRQTQGEPPLSWTEFRHGVGPSPEAPSPVVTTSRESGGVVRLTLAGAIDLDAAPALRGTLHDLLAEGHAHLRLDGSGVEFIDSLGVSVLMAVHARCVASGGSLRVESPSPRMRATLESIGVEDLLLDTL